MLKITSIEQKQYTHCLRCGRKLRTEQAKCLGYGPVCWRKTQEKSKKYRKLF